METVEIYFNDLNPDMQQVILEAAGIHDPSDGNWDICPLAIVSFESEVEIND